MAWHRAGAATCAAAAALAALATGCGSERSAEAYCKAFYAKAAPIRQSYVDAGDGAQQDPLAALVKVLSAPGDLTSIFDGMVDHAPDDIKGDTVVVRDSFKQLQDSMGKAIGNPLEALGEGVAGSLTSAGAMERVGAYLDKHCPVDSPLAQQYIQGAR